MALYDSIGILANISNIKLCFLGIPPYFATTYEMLSNA